MTGFGKSTATFSGKKVVVELRALNSKNLDIYLKVPALYKSKEIDIRKMIGQSLDRGKVEAIISIENTGDKQSYGINKSLALRYLNEMKALSSDTNIDESNLLATVVRLPDVLITEEADVTEEEWEALKEVISEALQSLIRFRSQEGNSLEEDFRDNIAKIQHLLDLVPNYEQERITAIKERIRKGLEEVAENIDENRFEHELIFYIEKLDISEEKVRLSNHLNYFLETMEKSQAVGKKLGFIAQEIGREVNTLGSKANHADLQKIVVDMKDALEKIKEQILNTL